MRVEEYLGFHVGDVVLDLAELTVGTATIKEFHLAPSDWGAGPTAVAIMENGAERYVIQLKKVPPPLVRLPDEPEDLDIHRRLKGR